MKLSTTSTVGVGLCVLSTLSSAHAAAIRQEPASDQALSSYCMLFEGSQRSQCLEKSSGQIDTIALPSIEAKEKRQDVSIFTYLADLAHEVSGRYLSRRDDDADCDSDGDDAASDCDSDDEGGTIVTAGTGQTTAGAPPQPTPGAPPQPAPDQPAPTVTAQPAPTATGEPAPTVTAQPAPTVTGQPAEAVKIRPAQVTGQSEKPVPKNALRRRTSRESNW